MGLQVLHLAPGVGDLQQGLLAWGVDLQVLELQESVQAAVLRHTAGQGGFAGLGPLVLVDADAALTGDADALQLAMGAVGVVQCGAVRQGQAGGFAAQAVGQAVAQGAACTQTGDAGVAADAGVGDGLTSLAACGVIAELGAGALAAAVVGVCPGGEVVFCVPGVAGGAYQGGGGA